MLKLTKMTKEAFENYMSFAIEAYANEKVNNGTWNKNNSLSNSKDTYNKILPNGMLTPNNYFYSINNDEIIIGYIWIAKSTDNEDTAFIYDFEIYNEFQNQGFGKTTIDLIGVEAKKLGFKNLALHVFGNNLRAIHVYKKAGFQTTDLNMRKEL
ncbi:GNAT family N-acetyltransferase [Lactococcus lactis]|uniref:GNAT family N-acetyltransferase n=1 Tax=Lactococcus lactis TaxID=1358 RepID=UPI00384E88A5